MKKRHFNQKPLWKRKRAKRKRLFDLLAEEIRKEIDKEIIERICSMAVKGTDFINIT